MAGPFTAVLADRGAERLRAGHPWVYEASILGWEPAPPAEAAETVRLRDRRGRELGLADFSPYSKIRLRLLSRAAGAAADTAFFRQRLERAWAWRRQIVRGSDAFRLVASEADGLPGLIVDAYGPLPGGALSFQTLTWAMAARQPLLLQQFMELWDPALLVERNEAKVRELEGLERRQGVLHGGSAMAEAAVNGLRLAFDLLGGQKTGGFLDQRENWAAAAEWARRFGVRSALDVFTYQGGFALHLARALPGVALEAVDSSRPALEAAEANAARNQLGEIPWIEANAFDLLRDYDHAGRQFDCVVLDPPAFAKSRAALGAAIGGYKEINLRALKLLTPGGLLVTCSCSHHLSEPAFVELLTAAAADARRELVLLERRGQALDHPVLPAFPESQYLKCLIFAVR